VFKLDDVPRDRTDKLQAKRQAILAEIAGLKTQNTLRDNLLKQKHIDAFTKVLREKLLENGAFTKEYLRLLVDEIRVNKKDVKLTGSYGAVAHAVAGNLGDSHGVPRFAPKWLPDLGSNQGHTD
jgi:site-specific DNA recombinase